MEQPINVPDEEPDSLEEQAHTYGYEAVDDPVELRIALRELYRVRAWIGQFAEVAAEMPGFAPESVVGVRSTGAMVTLLIERAEARLRILTATSTMPSPRRAGDFAAVDTPDGAGITAAG